MCVHASSCTITSKWLAKITVFLFNFFPSRLLCSWFYFLDFDGKMCSFPKLHFFVILTDCEQSMVDCDF